ncbi:YfiT family bacillithiol transferase [Paenibacillus spongiae]|uniref:Metal-dependent hydrolase n=1 Tax=Paenibacillus spongiae TaxID=2909671 RepID=A0ABY5SGK3_9BACL|nr:putative metal-dependent hydrolase [Paenibacillus spongiae]UVI33076.1 putative metal-dependent hydrolase [Paenibacillus spongiae]
MEQYRYPIGRFEPFPAPTPEDRNRLMEDIADAASRLRAAVQHLTMEQLQTPYRSGGWTIQQVIHHMADNDMNAYIRFKRALTEESPTATSYREDIWAEMRDYREPVELSITLLDVLHSRLVALLRSLAPEDFRKTFTSPTHGIMSLDLAMQRYAWHGRHHTAQIVSLKERMRWE